MAYRDKSQGHAFVYLDVKQLLKENAERGPGTPIEDILVKKKTPLPGGEDSGARRERGD